ncbi:MAG: hypothetical protein LBO08_01505 [Rickettsiales bacterium]|jgi:hypothetical protein|nr:hypothetical protein [Rickettsiales bacterium]
MQKLIILASVIFATACAQSTPSGPETVSAPAARAAVKQTCDPIYGRDSDWDIISDDLARNIYKHNRMCEQVNKKA